MPLARRTLAFVAFAAGLSACSDGTGPHAPNATVTVQATSLPATKVTLGATTWIQFTVPVRIENRGSTTLIYPYCAERVDGRVGSTWTPAWSPICMMTTDGAPLSIPPGESREFSESVEVAVAGPGVLPGLAAASDYRFVAPLALPGTSGRIPEVASNSFTLVVGN